MSDTQAPAQRPKPDPMQHMSIAGALGGGILITLLALGNMDTFGLVGVGIEMVLIWTVIGAFTGLALGSLSGMLLSMTLLGRHDTHDAITRADLHNRAPLAYGVIFVVTALLAGVFFVFLWMTVLATLLFAIVTGLLAVAAAYMYTARTEQWLKHAKPKRKRHHQDSDYTHLADSINDDTAHANVADTSSEQATRHSSQ